MEKRYMISDAAKLVDVEAHVLRYWEDELEIQIPRNEMGHRYYTDEIIAVFKEVKKLKDQGFLLKAIKMLMPELSAGKNVDELCSDISENAAVSVSQSVVTAAGIEPSSVEKRNTSAEDKMAQFQMILGNIVSKALEDNNASLGKTVSSQVSDSVIKQMDYLLRMKEEREEDRFKKLDETIRNTQRAGKEAATGAKRRGFSLKRKTV